MIKLLSCCMSEDKTKASAEKTGKIRISSVVQLIALYEHQFPSFENALYSPKMLLLRKLSGRRTDYRVCSILQSIMS